MNKIGLSLMSTWLVLMSTWLGFASQAQQTITLAQCYQSARENYPLLAQRSIVEQIGTQNVRSIRTHRYAPQLAVSGQASWQNEVTQLPVRLPNVEIEPLSKDQYKLTLDANYTLFDGSAAAAQARLQGANTVVEQQKVEVELNRLNEQVNACYLNALLIEENMALTRLLQNDLKARMDKLAGAVRYGTATQTSVDVLQAEFVKADQRLLEMNASRQGFRQVLALLTGLTIDENTVLQLPPTPALTPAALTSQIKRPESQLFTYQKTVFDLQQKLLDSRSAPRLSAFVQTGFGRPALNFLSNDFRGLFIGGLRLNWNISSLYTLKGERSVLRLQQKLIQTQQDAFDKNLAIQLRQQQTEIDKLQALIEKDQELVSLRTRIKTAATAQLENGTSTASDYINELTAENQARLNQKIHTYQLLMAQITYQTTTGNGWEKP